MKSDLFSLSAVYTRMIFRSWFQYKVDAILRSLAVFMREATAIIVIFFTLLKFDTLNGWNIYEVLFLSSLIYVTYGILIIFFTGLRDFGNTVRSGGFDRYILRPRGLLYQLIFANADWFAAVGQGGLGIVLFIISSCILSSKIISKILCFSIKFLKVVSILFFSSNSLIISLISFKAFIFFSKFLHFRHEYKKE